MYLTQESKLANEILRSKPQSCAIVTSHRIQSSVHESVVSISHSRLCMQVLQRVYRDGPLLHRCYSFHRCLCGCNRRDSWNTGQHSSAPDCLLIKERVLPSRSVDDELNAIAFDQIHDVWPPFLDLIYPLHAKAGTLKYVRGPFGCNNVKSKVRIAPR